MARSIPAELATAQAQLSRVPVGSVVARQMIITFSSLTAVAYSSYYPNAANGNSTPQCPIDHGISATYGSIWRVWMSSTKLGIFAVESPFAKSDWDSSTKVKDLTLQDSGTDPDDQHRPSIWGDRIFFGDNGDIRYYPIASATTLGASASLRASAYTVDTSKIALAAISESVVYVAELVESTDWKYIRFLRVTSSGVTICPITVPVEADYDEGALQWFDAETLGNKDVIVFNARRYGLPMAIFYEDDVWSELHPLMPMDVVDQYSYLRIAGITKQSDEYYGSSSDTLWATGRCGRKGSTGLHVQEFDVVLRSKDGIHWTFDRYAYVCSTNCRSRFLITGEKVYYPEGNDVMYATQTYLIGNDTSSLKTSITDDLLGLDYEQPRPGTAASGTVVVADHDGDYDSLLSAGQWLWLTLGYYYNGSDRTTTLATCGADIVPMSYVSGDRRLSLRYRDIAMRLMRDWASSLDWQWLSRGMLYDDCDLVDHMYSVSGASITVHDEDDHEVTTEVDETEIDTDENNEGLIFQVYNKVGIFFLTTPFDAKNFQVAARFTFNHDNESNSNAGGLPLDLTLTFPRTPNIGYGFGVLGCGVDEDRFITAWVDAKGEDLYILRSYLDGDGDQQWESLGSSALSSSPEKGEIYEVRLTRIGKQLEASCVHFDSGATPTRTELATVSYDWAKANEMCQDQDDDRGKLGIILNQRVAQTWLERVRESANEFARQAGLWDSSGNRQGPAVKTDDSYEDEYTEWNEGEDIVIEDERQTIAHVTQSDIKSKYYLVSSKGGNWVKAPDSVAEEDWEDDGDGFAWVLCFTDGPALGLAREITARSREWVEGTGWVVKYTMGGITEAEIAEVKENQSYFHVQPGFQISGRSNANGSQDHGFGTLARQHHDDHINVRAVFAYDDETDKTLEWVLEDIANKAGILEFVTSYNINTTVTPPSSGAPTWLTDVNSDNVYKRDFDITVTLPNLASNGDAFILIARATTQLASAPTNGNLTNWAAVKITYKRTGASEWTVYFHQTGTEGDNEDDWVLTDQYVMPGTSGYSGKRLRVVGYDRFFTLYVDDRWLRTFCVAPIYGTDTDGYAVASASSPGYIGVYRENGGGANWTDTEITEPQLWTWTDAVILDQRMDAVSGLRRAIKDRRIYWFGDQYGRLVIDTFDSRDDQGTVSDLIYMDQSQPHDRIPTHVRAVGAEIAEYVDHTYAALYGLTFAVIQTPSLEETESYNEAQRVIQDAVAESGIHYFTLAAQIDWETEDKVTGNYSPRDGGPSLNEDFVVSLVSIRFQPGDLYMRAELRKYIS